MTTKLLAVTLTLFSLGPFLHNNYNVIGTDLLVNGDI